jgi:hypothetical protein
MKTQEEIEQLAKKEYGDNLHNPFFTAAPMGYIKGYTKCQEDMADKKYTEEDLREAISLARKTKVNIFGANGEESIGFVHSNNEVLKIVVNKQD